MAYSYHPYPIAEILRVAIFTALLVAVLFAARQYAGNYFYILLVLILAIGFVRISSAYISSTIYTVTLTDESIIYTYGVFSRKETSLAYSKITESSFTQSVIQRILGTGNIYIDTPGGSDVALRLAEVRYSDI